MTFSLRSLAEFCATFWTAYRDRNAPFAVPPDRPWTGGDDN